MEKNDADGKKNDVFHLDLFWDWGLKNNALEINIYIPAAGKS